MSLMDTNFVLERVHWSTRKRFILEYVLCGEEKKKKSEAFLPCTEASPGVKLFLLMYSALERRICSDSSEGGFKVWVWNYIEAPTNHQSSFLVGSDFSKKSLLTKHIWVEFGTYRLTIVYCEKLMSQISIMYQPWGSASTSWSWNETVSHIAVRTPLFLESVFAVKLWGNYLFVHFGGDKLLKCFLRAKDTTFELLSFFPQWFALDRIG